MNLSYLMKWWRLEMHGFSVFLSPDSIRFVITYSCMMLGVTLFPTLGTHRSSWRKISTILQQIVILGSDVEQAKVHFPSFSARLTSMLHCCHISLFESCQREFPSINHRVGRLVEAANSPFRTANGDGWVCGCVRCGEVKRWASEGFVLTCSSNWSNTAAVWNWDWCSNQVSLQTPAWGLLFWNVASYSIETTWKNLFDYQNLIRILCLLTELKTYKPQQTKFKIQYYPMLLSGMSHLRVY